MAQESTSERKLNLDERSRELAQKAPPFASAGLVCAVVVTFHPESDLVTRLIALLPQLDGLLVVDNTPGGGYLEKIKEIGIDGSSLHIIENKANLGIAVALNQGIRYAEQQGFKWLLTLDQDTHWYPNMVEILIGVHRTCDPKPAIIGSNYHEPRNDRHMVPVGAASDHTDVKTVITSGSLIDVSVASTMGGFREDYFIDQVDHEFCLRARAYGYRVVISHKPTMAHGVGDDGGVHLPFLGILPNHPPLRKYYIARNTIVTIAQYWRLEPEWCARRMVRLILGFVLMATLEKQRRAKVTAFAAGILDGFKKRMGRYGRY
jgi:rhamnosyltransferase